MGVTFDFSRASAWRIVNDILIKQLDRSYLRFPAYMCAVYEIFIF